ncbi:MAG TPA: hypothetical protein VH482_14480 [Thermomicrobiales bacterium]
MTEFFETRGALLRMAVELPKIAAGEPKRVEVVVRVPDEEETGAETTTADDEPTWEDASWQ